MKTPVDNSMSFIRSISDASGFIHAFSMLEDVYFFMKDRRSRFMGANALQLKKMGVASESDVIGRTDYDFFPSHMISHYHLDDQRVMKTGKPILRRVEPVTNPDGTVSWHITSKFPLFNRSGDCIGLAGIMRDFDPGAGHFKSQTQMNRVLDHIAAHFSESVTVRKLAEVAGFSVSQFDRRFRSQFGQTPSRFLIRYRLTRASQMLINTDRTLSAVAQDTGFYDHSHFTREFRKMFGMAPGHYRRHHTKQEDVVSR